MTAATISRLDDELDARDRCFIRTGKIPPEYYLDAIAERLDADVSEVEARDRARGVP